MSGTEEVGLTDLSVFGFIRIATNRRAVVTPLTPQAAIQAVEGWLERPQVRFVTPGPRHVDIAFGLLKQLGTAGNLTTDAQLAAFAIEHQGEVHSNDADFARFPGLRWTNPLTL
jgi:toxin-antitoxin system PIN domain toxin